MSSDLTDINTPVNLTCKPNHHNGSIMLETFNMSNLNELYS